MCNDPAGAVYQKTLFLYRQLLSYWVEQGLPIMHLIRACRSGFSEESGEMALGKLAQNLPPNDASDIARCQSIWKPLRLYSKEMTEAKDGKRSKSRFLGKLCVLVIFSFVDTPLDKDAVAVISKHFLDVINQICDTDSNRISSSRSSRSSSSSSSSSRGYSQIQYTAQEI